MPKAEMVAQANSLLSDFTGSNKLGVLTPEQEDKFRIDLFQGSNFLSKVDLHLMDAPTKQISYLKVDDNPLSSPNVTSTNRGVTRKGSESRGFTLETKLMRGSVRIPDETIDQNIQNGTLPDAVRALIARRVGNQLARFVFLGDTTIAGKTIADPEELRLTEYFGLQNGIYKLANGVNTATNFQVSSADAWLPKDAPDLMSYSLPDRHLADATNNILFVTPIQFAKYKQLCLSTVASDYAFKYTPKTATENEYVTTPTGFKVMPEHALTYAHAYTETGQSAVTFTQRTKGLFLNPEYVAVGMFMGGMEMTNHYDFDNWQMIINFQTYVGVNHHYTDNVVIGTGLKYTP